MNLPRISHWTPSGQLAVGAWYLIVLAVIVKYGGMWSASQLLAFVAAAFMFATLGRAHLDFFLDD